MGSDHLPFHIALFLRIDLINAFLHRIKISEKHLKYLTGSFSEKADTILAGVADISDENPIAQYEFFIKFILDIAHSFAISSGWGDRARNRPHPHAQSSTGALPEIGRQHTRPAAPWWSDECGEAVARKKTPWESLAL